MAKLQTSEEDKLIGKRIQQKRKEKGFSAAFLSEQLNLSQQQLSRYETGSNKINVSHLIEIADYLETPISWFFLDCDKTTQALSILRAPTEQLDLLSLKEMKTRLDEIWEKMTLEQRVSLLQFLMKMQRD